MRFLSSGTSVTEAERNRYPKSVLEPDPPLAVSRRESMIRAAKAFVLALFMTGALTACATRPPPPANISAPFVIERDLAGRNTARGTFRSITGARRDFTAELSGAWDGRVLILVEQFAFDDGERDTKTWRLQRAANGEWSGTREDVVGTARGFQDGDVFRLEYDVNLATGNGGTRKVRFRDVLALRGPGVIINTATVGWYGLRVGSVELTMTRPQAAQ